MQILTLPYPQRRAEIIAFVKKHHYSRRCMGVWSVSYTLVNEQTGKIQGVALYGPPPYPSIARRFTYGPQYEARLAWQSRLVGAGISATQLDELIQYANTDLIGRGFWWVLTLTDPHARIVDNFTLRLVQRGYSGEVYHRNRFLFIGHTSARGAVEGWILDNTRFIHARQGRRTVTQGNVHQLYPQAKKIRCVRSLPKQRWVYILAQTERERAERIRLMRYQPQPWQPLIQPRLLRSQLPRPARATPLTLVTG